MRHPEVALEILLGVAAALLAHHHHRFTIEACPPANDRRVLTEQPVAVKLHEIGEAESDVVERERPLGVPSDLNALQR